MRLILLFIFLISFSACKKESAKSNHPPKLEFINLTPNEFKNGAFDSIRISLKFYDKDGDVGSDDPNGPPNIFIMNTFDTANSNSGARLPVLPPNFEGQPIEGSAIVLIPTTFFTLDSARLQTGDTFHFKICIKDKAGNTSDTVRTSDIIITP